MRIARHEIVGAGGLRERDEVIVVGVGGGRARGRRRIFDKRRAEPHSRNEEVCLLLSQPAPQALSGEYVFELCQQLGTDDQLEAFLRPGVQQRGRDALGRQARRDEDVWVKDDARARRLPAAPGERRGPR